MPATPRTHPPAALRLVDAAPARGRSHRVGSASTRPQRSAGERAADLSGRFVLTVRALAMAARSLGLSAPSFQSPPRSDQLDRSIQRGGDGDCVVAVRVRGRPFAAVVADAIEGIVVCNRLSASAAAAVRDELWREIEGSHDAAGPARPCPAPSEGGRRTPGTVAEPYTLDEVA